MTATILIRAVLGKRVRELIIDNAETVQFFAPESTFLHSKDQN